jgi:transposase-like protein
MPPSLAMAPIVSSKSRRGRRLYSLATKRRIVQLANQANQVTPDKSSVFLIAKQHHVLPCQIERWRNQFEIIDATIVDATIVD